MARALVCAALLGLLALVAAQQAVPSAADNPTGVVQTAQAASPFLNPDARAAQFGYRSANSGEYCVSRSVVFGDATTFEAWILPTKANGGILTAVNLDAATNAPHNDDQVSFRLVNWRIQLFIAGMPYGGGDISTVKVDSNEMITPLRWTRVFGTINPQPATNTTTVCVIFEGWTADSGGNGHVVSTCTTSNIAFPTRTRTHIYVGDDSVLSPVGNFRGEIESLRIWKVAFTPAEAHALQTIPAADNRLGSQWTFDECPTLLGCVATASDSSGNRPGTLLSCGSGDCNKSPTCVLTSNPINQIGGFETWAPEPQPLGSGRTAPPGQKTTLPPLIATTQPPRTTLRCPPPAATMFYGDPHVTVYDGQGRQIRVFDYNGYGWHWIASTTLSSGEVIALQINYMDCGGPTTCPGAIAWRNKRELGWWTNGDRSVTITNDGAAVAWNNAGVTTPMGSVVRLGTDRNGNPQISLQIPGAFTLTGVTAGDGWLYYTTHWTMNFDSAFSGMTPDGRACADPTNGWGTTPVANSDRFYQGRVPPMCTTCPIPPSDLPPACPRSAAANAECGAVPGQRCAWDAATCPCIVQVCYDENFVSPLHRAACLMDAAEGQSVVPSMEATFRECMGALGVLLRSDPAPTQDDPRLAQYSCRAGRHCPNFCNGPCHGTCNADFTCTCRPGWMGSDCGTAVANPRGRKRAVGAANEVSGFIQDYAPATTFYAYDAASGSATAANHVQAAGLASFFLYTQIPPPYPVDVQGALPMFSPAVTSFGVTINRLNSGIATSLQVSVQIRDQNTNAPITGASVQLKDDDSDSYAWNSNTASGTFSWAAQSTGTDGMLLGPLPPPQNAYCVDVTITAATGIDKFAVMVGDAGDKAVPKMQTVPGTPGSTFSVCTLPATDPCMAHTDCASCNAQAECGWCDSAQTCYTGTTAGPSGVAECTTWRSETEATVSRVVEHRSNTAGSVRTSQIRAYLAPDNVPVTVPVWVSLPESPASFKYNVRGLFEFTDQMSTFYAKFLGPSASAFATAVNQVSPGSMLAVSSFRDKPHVQPHGRAGDYIYKEHTAFMRADVATSLSAEFASWAASPQLVSDFKPELGVATLEALFHEVHHGWELSPAPMTKNVVLVFTKSPVAKAGIPVAASDATNVVLGMPLPPNNGDQVVDDYEDYPSAVLTAKALIARGIIPVFVVPDAVGTEEVVASYRSLVSAWGFGRVWPDAAGRNALKSSMSAAEGAAVLANILADLASTVQIVSSDPEVTTTLASPALASASDLPLGAVVSLPITLQRTTSASRKRDVDAELYRLFYKDRRMVSVMGLGSFEVVSATTDAPSAEDLDFTINVGETSSVAHVLPIPSYSIYDQMLTAYVVAKPGAGVALYNVLPGSMPEAKGTPIDATGLISDVLRRVYIDVPATAVGDQTNGFVLTTFTYKTVDPCGLESRVGTVTVRVVPPGVHAPERYEPPSAGFKVTVDENTVSKPTSALVCVGGIDYDPNSKISTKLVAVPEHGTLYHIVDSRGSRGSAGAQAKAGDVVTSAYGAKEAPAVACFVYVPPVRDTSNASPFGPAYGRFQWQLVDSTGLVSAIETTAVDVLPVNYPPIAADASVTGFESTPLFVDITAYDDPRPDGVNGGPVQVKLTVAPIRGSLASKEGTPIVLSAVLAGSPITVLYTPKPNAHSDVDANGGLSLFDYFTYVVTDAGGLSASATVRVYINPATSLPKLSFENSAWTYPVVTVNTAKAAQVCLTVANLKNTAESGVYITALPKQGAISTANGQHQLPIALDKSASGAFCFSYSPKSGAFGTDTVSIKVCDSCGPATGANFQALLAAAPATSVTMDLPDKSRAARNNLTGGAVAGIVVGSLVAAVVLLGVLVVIFKARTGGQTSSVSGNSQLKTPLL